MLVRLLISTLILLICSFSSAENAQLDCQPLFDINQQGIPYKCNERSDFGFPTKIQGYDIDLYTYVPIDGDVHPDFLALSQNLKSIAEKSFAVYLKYGKLVNLKFLLSNEMPAEYGTIAYAHWSAIYDKGSCNIVVYFNAPTEQLNKTVAHEIAHCFQAANLGLPHNYDTIDKWWVEGGAEYLATLVFPEDPVSYILYHNYRAGFDPVRQPVPYSTALLFQSFANSGMTIQEYFAQVKLYMSTVDLESAYQVLNQWPDILERYHSFFEKYSSDIGIADSTGKIIFATQNMTKPARVFSTQEENYTAFNLDIMPWTVNKNLIFLSQIAKYKITVDADEIQEHKLSYRIGNTNLWTRVQGSTVLHVQTSCSDDDNGYIEFLSTTTGPISIPKMLTVTVEVEDVQTCNCKQSQAALDTCLIGTWKVDNEQLESFRQTPGVPMKIKYTGDVIYEIKAGEAQTQTLFKDFATIFSGMTIQPPKPGLDPIVVPESKTVQNGYYKFTVLTQTKGKTCFKQEKIDMITDQYTDGQLIESKPEVEGPSEELYSVSYKCEGSNLILNKKTTYEGTSIFEVLPLVRIK